MSQNPLHAMDVDARPEQDSRATMPQVVEANPPGKRARPKQEETPEREPIRLDESVSSAVGATLSRLVKEGRVKKDKVRGYRTA